MQEELTEKSKIVYGKNPVIELLNSEEIVDTIFILRTPEKNPIIGKIKALARDKGVPVKEASKEKLDKFSEGGVHQGVVAFCAAASYSEFSDIEKLAEDRNEKPFIIICDEIEDPHNLGAIIRTAECAGAHGVIVPRRHSASLSASAVKASAGAVSYLPVVRVANIASFIDEIKKKNYWVYGADMGGTDYTQVNFSGSCALVIGSEGNGISKLVKSKCDVIAGIPMFGKINSLNASVSAALLIYEVVRQRRIK